MGFCFNTQIRYIENEKAFRKEFSAVRLYPNEKNQWKKSPLVGGG